MAAPGGHYPPGAPQGAYYSTTHTVQSTATWTTSQGPPPPASLPPPVPVVNPYAAPCYCTREGELASLHGECAVCFEALHKEVVGVLVASGRRACGHFLHLRCCEDLARAGLRACPLCRAPYTDTARVPPLSDPQAWFRVVDVDGDGRLSRREVLEVLRACLPVNVELLEQNQELLWAQWDVDGSGYLDYQELLHPQTGLIAWVEANFRRGDGARAPDIRADKEAWFKHWDRDNSGTLDQTEITRALIKSFNLSGAAAKRAEMKEVVAAVWPIFDLDGGGTICRAEFGAPDGLADTIIASYRT